MEQKKNHQSSGMRIPDEAIERIARVMLPLMQQYFESDEGQQQLKEWENALKQKETVQA